MSEKEKEQKEEIIIEEDETGALPADRLKKLKEKLKKCQKERGEYLTGWQRAKADFINARREEENNRENFIKFAESKIIEELFGLVDSFEAVLGNEGLWSSLDKDWQSGIKSMYSQLMKILEKHGVSAIESMGKTFNPQEHESMEEILVDDESKNNIILEEVSRGYKLYDLVLRPARVKIGVYRSNK